MQLEPLRPDQTDDGALYDKLDAKADHIAGHTRLIVLASIAVLLVAGLAVVFSRSSAEPAPKGHTITGAVDLRSLSFDYYKMAEGEWCTGSGGFKDLREGGQVLVLNQDGTTVGTGTLSPGKQLSARRALCTWTFSVAGVPESSFYRVKVNHRDGPTYSTVDMAARGWVVDLTLS
jgi:hypothetical protein